MSGLEGTAVGANSPDAQGHYCEPTNLPPSPLEMGGHLPLERGPGEPELDDSVVEIEPNDAITTVRELLACRNPGLMHAFDDAFNEERVEQPPTRPVFELSFNTVSTGLKPLGPLQPDVQVPRHYICPITHEAMAQPVVAMDGFSYEKAAILQWLKQSSQCKSPMTGEPMVDGRITPNHVLHSMIREFYDKHRDDSLEYFEHLLSSMAKE